MPAFKKGDKVWSLESQAWGKIEHVDNPDTSLEEYLVSGIDDSSFDGYLDTEEFKDFKHLKGNCIFTTPDDLVAEKDFNVDEHEF